MMTQTYHNAICLPCHGAENRPLFAEGATGGVCTSDGTPIKESAFYRQYRKGVRIVADQWDRDKNHEILTTPMVLPRAPGQTHHRLQGRHIFAGYLFPHYGHFLLESLARLWFIKQHPDVPLVWLGVHNQPDFNKMNLELFELLNINNPMHIITEQTEIEELLVPDTGYIINTRFTPAQKDALRAVPPTDPTPGKRVWLSRSLLDRGIVHNEATLETLLEASGWIIYHPEQHPIADQVNMLADAEFIAGIEGSALHSLVLFPDFKGRVVIFVRAGEVNMDYMIIADMLGLNQRMLSPNRINWCRDRARWESDWVWPNLDLQLEVLEASRINRPWKPVPKPLEKITESILAFFKGRSLVEFWPTDNSVTTLGPRAMAIAVGDKMHFDLTPLKARNDIHCFDLNSDQFLSTRSAEATFDVYVLRLQEDFGTLLRAFNAMLTFSTLNTIWIVEGAKEGKTSGNEQLLAYVLENFSTLTLAKVQKSNITLIWRQNRRGPLTAIPASEKEKSSFHAPVPVHPINEIAKMIAEARKPSLKK